MSNIECQILCFSSGSSTVMIFCLENSSISDRLTCSQFVVSWHRHIINLQCKQLNKSTCLKCAQRIRSFLYSDLFRPLKWIRFHLSSFLQRYDCLLCRKELYRTTKNLPPICHIGARVHYRFSTNFKQIWQRWLAFFGLRIIYDLSAKPLFFTVR